MTLMTRMMFMFIFTLAILEEFDDSIVDTAEEPGGGPSAAAATDLRLLTAGGIIIE